MPLAEYHWLILGAVIDRIVPPDEWPSAGEAGGLEFFSRLLPIEGLERVYELGLAAIDAESHVRFDLPFDALASETQDELLSDIEKGVVRTPWEVEPKAFFALLAAQAIESYYADPSNGGNRDAVSWEMVGFRVTA